MGKQVCPVGRNQGGQIGSGVLHSATHPNHVRNVRESSGIVICKSVCKPIWSNDLGNEVRVWPRGGVPKRYASPVNIQDFIKPQRAVGQDVIKLHWVSVRIFLFTQKVSC